MTLLQAISPSLQPGADRPIGWREAGVFFLLLALLQAAFLFLGLEYFAALAIIGLGATFLILSNETLWIFTVILAYVPVFWKSTDDFTAVEAAQAVLFYGGMLWWFIRRTLVDRRPIQWSVPGILFSAFFLYCLILIPVSLANEADPFILTREVFVIGGTLLFLPIANAFGNERKQRWLFVALFTLVVPIAIKNVMNYQQRVLSAVAYWQIGASREAESVFFFFVTAIFAFAFLVSVRRHLHRVFWLGAFGVSVVSAILSFYRSIWAMIAFGLFLMGTWLGMRYWRQAVSYGLAGGIAVFIGVSVYFSGTGPLEAIAEAVVDRFVSVSGYSEDPSLINRNVESQAAWEQTSSHLLIGRGLGTQVVFRNYITYETVHTTWNHNAYPWMVFHFGIIGSLLLLGAYGGYLYKAWRIQRKLRLCRDMDPDRRFRRRALATAAGTVIAGFVLLSLTLNQYMARDAALAMAIIWGLLDSWDREVQQRLDCAKKGPAADELPPAVVPDGDVPPPPYRPDDVERA